MMAADGGKDRISALPDKEGGKDRISTLSDKQVHRLLSFLPAQEAVRTCVLSRRWRDIWKSMPVLRLTEVGSPRSSKDFRKFVNHLLFFRNLTPLEEFELNPVYHCEMWIRYALMHKVRVLRILSYFGYKVEVSFISQHLMILELANVNLDACSLDFSSCPLLEDLKMTRCRIFARKMSSPALRRLCIAECEFNCYPSSILYSGPPHPDDGKQLQIFSRNLVALRLVVNTGRTPFLGSTPLLVSAFIKHNDLWRTKCQHCCCYTCTESYGCEDTSEACLLLEGLSNATGLELEPAFGVFDRAISKRDLKWCPTFSNLKTLVLNDWDLGRMGIDTGLRGLIFFLQHAPILEKLTLHIYGGMYMMNMEGRFSLVKQFIPSEHLKIVEVRCIEAVANVLVEILIAVASLLI